MNAPLVFMAAPLAAAVPSYFLFPLRPRSVSLCSSLFAAGLAWLASTVPLDSPWSLLGFAVPVDGSFLFLGRPFIFDPSLKSAVVFLFAGGAALFLGSLALPPSRGIVPVGLVVLGLFSASLFVRPFLFAAFFLFLSVLFLSLLLSDPAYPAPRGAVRWICYSALGTIILLLAGSELSSLEKLPAGAGEFPPLLFLLGLGFGLILSFPPFHFWLPEVVDDSPPYSVSAILSLYIGAAVFFLLRFLDGFSWLRQSPGTSLILVVGGSGMCFTGALFSLIQERLGRCVGYLSLCNLGAILLALSFSDSLGAQVAVVLLASRGFSLLVWGISFNALRPKQAGDRIQDLLGVAAVRPFAFSAVLISALSLVGAPGLLSFPPLMALLLSNQSHYGLSSLGGLLSLSIFFSIASGLFSLYRFARPMLDFAAATQLTEEKSRLRRSFFLAALFIMLLFGLFPQLYLPFVTTAAAAFFNLSAIP
ncbi:MAG: hypothetical protein JW929_02775 [Anaerolineales bacterium]|nr:hypothetical protein [Anaerolineales bacterium]